MRSIRNPVIVFGLVLLRASIVMASIAGSAHDLGELSWSREMVCQPCHVSHRANDVKAPLWNHARPEAPVIAYEGPTGSFDATIDQPRCGTSAACLGCHDGSVALDTFGDALGGASRIGSSFVICSDLSHDRPVANTS